MLLDSNLDLNLLLDLCNVHDLHLLGPLFHNSGTLGILDLLAFYTHKSYNGVNTPVVLIDLVLGLATLNGRALFA